MTTPKSVTISRFMKLHYVKNNHNYRVLNVSSEGVTLINMDNPNRIDISLCGGRELRNLILSGEVEIVEEPEESTIINEEFLSEHVRRNYLRNKLIIDAVNAKYAPDYLGLIRKRKPVVKEIMERSNLSPRSVRKIIIRYLQSGCKEIGLLRRERTDNLKDRTTAHKRGRVSDIPERNGKNLTDADRNNLSEYAKKYLANPLITKKKCYDDMINEKYSKETYGKNGYAYDFQELDNKMHTEFQYLSSVLFHPTYLLKSSCNFV